MDKDTWRTLFDGQTRYFLDINDSTVKPDKLINIEPDY